MEKYILITGATAGFGEATARHFAQHGWNLILTGRRDERLQKIKQELSSRFKIDVVTCCFDVRNEQEVHEAIHSLDKGVADKIEILLNNAGLAVGRAMIQDGESDDWNRMIDTNIKGLLYVTSAVVPLFIAKNRGHIINLGSIAGKEVYPAGNVYCATKHAVDALSKGMRMDLLEHGIKVTTIAPGAAETEFSIVRFKGNTANAKSVYEGFDPLTAEDVAETIYFVATRPAHVTISDITIMPTAQASSTMLYRTQEKK
jgi:3-hydroxy acid dehydrogenase/malonic semialdehyde reductase